MQLATVKDVSKLLQVKEKTLYQWAESKQIPCLKLNGSLRFDIEDIKTWMDSCKKSPNNGYNPITRLEARKGGMNN
jgi:excisionase family DNA binding protein